MRIGPAKLAANEVYFIAEAGVNHNGDLDVAEALIDAAADAGADAVKFQTFTAERLVTASARTVDYQRESAGVETQREMLEQYELDRADHERLIAYADDREITLLSSPFDEQSASLLADLGLPAIKIGSGELTNTPLLAHVAELGRPMIVSTGMSTMAEVHTAREAIRDVAPELPVAFMHCTSEYPAPMSAVNLRAMERMNAELPEPVGYSDHTTAVETPAMAVAAGARLLEKHFTLDRSLPGPDHEASLEPGELASAVDLAHEAAVARGSPEKQPTEGELENRSAIRKSLHAASAVEAGQPLTAETLAIVRPADGLAPAEFQRVLGTRVTKSLQSGDPITETVLEPE